MTQTDLGNTRAKSLKIRSRNWFFTINNYNEEIMTQIKVYFDNVAFQEELSDSGTKHLQGVGSFKNPRTFSSIKNKWPKWHIERCRSIKKSIAYCQKEDTRNGIRFQNYYEEVEDVIADKGGYDWQKSVIKHVTGVPDKRKIFWIWEEKGNSGKTALAKHLVLKHNAIVVGGNARDAQYAIMKRVENKDFPKIVIFDIPRSQNKVSYKAIESIKNGLFFAPKYESSMCCFNIPHVLIFSNSKYEPEKLSMDRWVNVKLA